MKKGELFAFLGINGAGKSTTINIMCGQLSKDSGSVFIDKRDLDKDMDYIKRELGVVFQLSVLDSALSVYDNLESRAALYGITGMEFKKRLEELAKILDFENLLKRTVGKLSGGQRRRIDIARALFHKPKILILDEPTTGLDPQTRRLIWNVISSFRKDENMTVFLTTHYMEEAAEADYVVIIDDGKISAEGTPLELKNIYTGDYITIHDVDEKDIKELDVEYEQIRNGYRLSVPNTKAATELIIRNPQLFNDYEITKGKMDDVFLAVTGKNWWEVQKNEYGFHSYQKKYQIVFKDKGMFFTSLITPAILLVLYVTFLGNVYRDSFTSNLPNSLKLSESIIEGLVDGQLISSILAVSCVTVAFCSNFLMVQDKANGTIRDLRISPVKSATLSLSYYVATLLSTLIICFAATGICLTYVAIVGWYMSLADIFFLFLDILLLVLFGTALSSIINFFLSTQGQISAVGTIISAGYGFICGAYMPISSFGEGLQKIISFLPGTYGTSLIRNHTMQGALAEMQNQGIPTGAIEKLKDSLDCNLYFFGSQVNIGTMYMIFGITILVLIGIYILLNKSKKYNC